MRGVDTTARPKDGASCALPSFERPILLSRRDDVDRENRGFRIDRVTAWHGDRLVGCVKVEWIPAAAFRAFHPTIFNYLSQIAGISGCMPHGREHVRPETLSDPELANLAARTRSLRWGGDAAEYAGLDRPALLDVVRSIEAAHLAGETGERYAGFRRYHVDRPFIAYVSVEDDVRRRGLATLLYAEAADWMRDKGLVLRSSTLQTEPAAAAWAKYDRMGLTRRDRDGRRMLAPRAGDALRASIGAIRI